MNATTTTATPRSIFERDNGNHVVGKNATRAFTSTDRCEISPPDVQYLDLDLDLDLDLEDFFCKTPSVTQLKVNQPPPILSSTRRKGVIDTNNTISWPKLDLGHNAPKIADTCIEDRHKIKYFMQPRLNNQRSRQFQLSVKLHCNDSDSPQKESCTFSPTSPQGLFFYDEAESENGLHKKNAV